MGQILQVNDLHVYYGSIHAVKGVSFAALLKAGKPLINAFQVRFDTGKGLELMASDRVQKAYLGG